MEVAERGEVAFHEGYLTRREARKLAAGGTVETAKPTRPEVTGPMQTYVDLHRHAATRAALLDHPSVALRLMIAHAVVGSSLWTVRVERQYRTGMVDELRRREVVRVGAQLSRELGMPFAESGDGERIAGVYRRPVDLMGGRFAVIERARDFTLVPWRPVLEQQIGKSVSGVLHGDSVSWTMGRGRSGPSIS